jgi:hypothetical protein
MEPSRVYKIKIRENILRQVIFTDRNLFLGLVVGIIAFVWKGLENFSTDVKVFACLSISGIALLIFSIKIDRQTIIKLIPRLINYSKKNKKSRY